MKHFVMSQLWKHRGGTQRSLNETDTPFTPGIKM